MSGMKDQLGDDLFYPSEAFARNTDPSTSHVAAASMKPKRLNDLETAVLKAIASLPQGGATNDDIVRITGLDWKTATPRVKPLRDKGLVVSRLVRETGQELTRKGLSGRSQIVWFATVEGMVHAGAGR